MSSASKNLHEQPQQLSRQPWDNAAHSYLQPIDLDSLDKTSDQLIYSPFISDAVSSIQSEHDSPRTNTQKPNHFSPKALNWPKENEAIPSRTCHEGTYIYFPSRRLNHTFRDINIDHKRFFIFNLVTKRRSIRTGFQTNNARYWRRRSQSQITLTTLGDSSWRTNSNRRKVSSRFGFRIVSQSRGDFAIQLTIYPYRRKNSINML